MNSRLKLLLWICIQCIVRWTLLFQPGRGFQCRFRLTPWTTYHKRCLVLNMTMPVTIRDRPDVHGWSVCIRRLPWQRQPDPTSEIMSWGDIVWWAWRELCMLSDLIYNETVGLTPEIAQCMMPLSAATEREKFNTCGHKIIFLRHLQILRTYFNISNVSKPVRHPFQTFAENCTKL